MRRFKWGIFLAMVAIPMGWLIWAFYETYGPGGSAKETACRSRVKMFAKALLVYAVDSDGHLPPARDWMDVTKGKYESDLFRCPEVRSRGSFGYAMNSELSGAQVSSIADHGKKALVYDSSNLSWNAHDAFASLPLPDRHRSGNMVGYLDGHVRPVQNKD